MVGWWLSHVLVEQHPNIVDIISNRYLVKWRETNPKHGWRRDIYQTPSIYDGFFHSYGIFPKVDEHHQCIDDRVIKQLVGWSLDDVFPPFFSKFSEAAPGCRWRARARRRVPHWSGRRNPRRGTGRSELALRGRWIWTNYNVNQRPHHRWLWM